MYDIQPSEITSRHVPFWATYRLSARECEIVIDRVIKKVLQSTIHKFKTACWDRSFWICGALFVPWNYNLRFVHTWLLRLRQSLTLHQWWSKRRQWVRSLNQCLGFYWHNVKLWRWRKCGRQLWTGHNFIFQHFFKFLICPIMETASYRFEIATTENFVDFLFRH